MTNSEFPKGIEVVVACLVVSNGGKILLSKHPSWADGENGFCMEATLSLARPYLPRPREKQMKKLGLSAKTIRVIDSGENIMSEKQAHYVWFCCLLEARSETASAKEELTETKWFSKNDVLTQDLVDGYKKMIEKYLEQI